MIISCFLLNHDKHSKGNYTCKSISSCLVVGMRLGCINHALLTAEAIISRGLVLAGWVANQVDPDMRFVDENVAALEQRMPAPLLGRVPRLEQVSAAGAAAYIELAGVPGWPLMRS